MNRMDTRRALLAVAALLAAAGCGSGGARSAREQHPLPPDTMRVAMAETGRQGGRMIVAQPGDPRTFNAMMSNEQSSNEVNNLLWAALVDYDYERGGPLPMLAKSWELSGDSTTYTWHLRRGLRFSDGRPITSADVMFSAEVAYDSVLHPVVQDVVKVEGQPMEFSAPDSYTVVTRVRRPYGLAIWAMSSLRILPRHVMEPAYRAGAFGSAYHSGTAPESVVTSGAWRLKAFVPREKTVLEPNPWWFKVDSRGQRLPYLDELVFLVVPDQNAAALKFESGEVDVTDRLNADEYPRFEAMQKEKDFTLYRVGTSLSSNFFWFNLARVRAAGKGRRVGDPCVPAWKFAWFGDADFRRAVSKAIDRDNIIRSAYHGNAVKNWSTTTPGNAFWNSADLSGDDYDPEGARQLLAGMGLGDRNGDGVLEDGAGHAVEFSLTTNTDNNTRKTLAQLVAEDLGKVGVRVNVEPAEFNSLMPKYRETFQYEAMLLGLGSGVPPDPGMSRNVFHSSGLTHFWNVAQKSPATPAEAELDGLADRLAVSADPAERHRIWRRMQELMLRENFFIWLPSQVVRIPVRNRFGNVAPQPVPHRVLWNVDRIFEKRPQRPS